MSLNERLKKNLMRWACFRPAAAQIVLNLPKIDVYFCQASNGAVNLCKEIDGHQFFYHSNSDPVEEANRWFAELPKNKGETIYIYGLGLGYYYQAAKQWLAEDEQRSLVYIEDDPQVIRRFFESELATEFLHNRQTFLDFIQMQNKPWSAIEKLTVIFSSKGFITTSLKAYENNSSDQEFKSLIDFFSTGAKRTTLEYASASLPFYTNFFPNILETHIFQAKHMYGKFTDVPAIVCGAGPSIDKNVELLGTLKDRALIFAGGSAINALNGHGINPHFGVGVDPNSTQMTRLVMNQAYETPFFYRTRMQHEAFKMIHGDKIYVAGNGGHKISEWFEHKLGTDAELVQEGHNVLNLSLSIAQLLGCNPILVIGADLAYTNEKSYSSGIVSHPIHDQKIHFRTKHESEELVNRNDIYGQPILTTWKWVAESLWYSKIASEFPTLNIINVTEGGIGFPNIRNMTLKDAVEAFLPPPTDLQARVLGAIHYSVMPPSVTDENLISLMEEFKTSLERCVKYTEDIRTTINELHSQMSLKNGEYPEPDQALLNKREEAEKALHEEDAYKFDLFEFNAAFIRYVALELQRLQFDKDVRPEEQIKLRRLSIDAYRYKVLNEDALKHIQLIDIWIEHLKNTSSQTTEWANGEGREYLEELKAKYPVPKPNARDKYSFENGHLTIHDHEMGISFSDTFSDHDEWKFSLEFPPGALQIESCYKNGLLHGPSKVFVVDEKLLVHTWFWHGQRQGKSWSYYRSGGLQSLQRFHNNQLEGKQQYFYENGLPKSILEYSKGLLHGNVILWHRSGKMSRQLHFVHGKRQGVEKFWDEQGLLRIEANYKADKPIGIAKKWHLNGVLAKEIEYDQNSRPIHAKFWNQNGEEMPIEESRLDYFDEVTGQIAKLTTSLDHVYNEIIDMIPMVIEKELDGKKSPLNSGPPAVPSKNLEKLKAEMERLQSLTMSLKTESGLGEGHHKEAIWKTPTMQKLLEKQVEDLGKIMDNGLANIQNDLKELIKQLNKPPKDP